MVKARKFSGSVIRAWTGIVSAIRSEQNFRVQMYCAVIALLACVLLHVDAVAMSLVFISCTIVLCLELVNTSLEQCLDLVESRLSQRVMQAKDVMAGAVMLASFSAIVIACLILLPKLTVVLGQLIAVRAVLS